jgi:hypothetical protein
MSSSPADPVCPLIFLDKEIVNQRSQCSPIAWSNCPTYIKLGQIPSLREDLCQIHH